MTPEHLAQLLRGGEGLTVEFKRVREALNRDTYETICAFLNQRGGTLVLGAADDGTVTGIAPEALAPMRKDLANTLHNPQKINPPMPLVPENSNNPHGLGLLRPDEFAPSPKNPAIARVFREMQWAESGAESPEHRLLAALSAGALGKAELANRLGLPAVSGALNRRVRRLLDAGLLEYTLPDKPTSRLQQFQELNPS